MSKDREYYIISLKEMIENKEIGEQKTRELLSNFECNINLDVENFIRNKAIEFSNQSLARTFLIYTEFKKKYVLIAYFTIAGKTIQIDNTGLSKTFKNRIQRFAIYYSNIDAYIISTPLIAQLGKNYSDGYNKLISGDDLLEIACNKVREAQDILDGKLTYLECEDIPSLIDFYKRNEFIQSSKRTRDKNEESNEEKYLIQMIRYLS